MAYVFLVNQLDQDVRLQSSHESDEKPSAEEKAMSVVVSSFAAPLAYVSRSHGFNFSRNENITEEWSESEKEIFNAVINGDVDKVNQLLESGLDPSLKDSEGMSPLHFAADRGHLELLQILLKKGAFVDSINSDGQSPLMLAMTCEHTVRPIPYRQLTMSRK